MEVLELAQLRLGSRRVIATVVFQPPPAQVGVGRNVNRLHVGVAGAPTLQRLPTAEGEEPQELPARSADLSQGELPGPPGAESEEPRRVPG